MENLNFAGSGKKLGGFSEKTAVEQTELVVLPGDVPDVPEKISGNENWHTFFWGVFSTNNGMTGPASNRVLDDVIPNPSASHDFPWPISEDKQRPDNKYVVLAHQDAKRISKNLARVTQPEVACHLTREAGPAGDGAGRGFACTSRFGSLVPPDLVRLYLQIWVYAF